MEKNHNISRRSLNVVFWALIILLAISVGLSYIDMRGYGAIPAYLVAAAKAALVILFFMEVKIASRLTWVFVGAAFLWLAVLMLMTTGDYVTRGWTPGSEIIAPQRMPMMSEPEAMNP